MVSDGAHRYPQDGSDAPIRPVLDERPEDLQFAPGQPGRAAGCRHGPDRTQVARRLGGASDHGDPHKSALAWRPVVGGQERGVAAFGVDVPAGRREHGGVRRQEGMRRRPGKGQRLPGAADDLAADSGMSSR